MVYFILFFLGSCHVLCCVVLCAVALTPPSPPPPPTALESILAHASRISLPSTPELAAIYTEGRCPGLGLVINGLRVSRLNQVPLKLRLWESSHSGGGGGGGGGAGAGIGGRSLSTGVVRTSSHQHQHQHQHLYSPDFLLTRFRLVTAGKGSIYTYSTIHSLSCSSLSPLFQTLIYYIFYFYYTHPSLPFPL